MPTKKIGEKVTNLSQLQVEDGVLYDENAVPVPVASLRFWKSPSEGISVPVPSTANVYGPEVVIKEGKALVPLSIHYGGQTGDTEAITVKIRIYYSDNSFTENTAPFNTPTMQWIPPAKWGGAPWDDPDDFSNGSLDWAAKDGVYITKITAFAKTNTANSTAIVKVAAIGIGA